MNAFTYEKTFNYLYSKNRYVVVRKYMIAKDEEGQRYAIFQLVNNYRDTLQQVRLKIEQFDRNNNLVYTNDIPYEGLSIKHNGKFVPFFKLALDNHTTRIATTLIAAKFENHVYVDEKMIRVKKEKVEEEKELKDKIVRRYNAISSKSPFKSFMIMSLITAILASIIIGVFSIVNKEAVYDNFQYNKATGEIVSYLGTQANVTIPSKIKNTSITKIGNNAFKNNSIVNIVFDSPNIEIGDNAFINCRYLRSVKGKTITSIGQSAFENCVSLSDLDVDDIINVGKSAFKSCSTLSTFDFNGCKSVGTFAFNYCVNLQLVNVPNATVTTNVFYENPGLRTFTFGNVDAYYTRLFTIFSNESNFPQLEVNNYIQSVDVNFLNDFNCGRLNFLNYDVTMPNSVRKKWESLAMSHNGYTNTALYTKMFDTITSFNNPGDESLSLTDRSVKGITAQAWNSIANNVRYLTLNNYVYLTAKMLAKCRNLVSLSLGPNNYIEESSISSPNLINITLPVLGSSFASLFASYPMGTVDVILVGDKTVKENYFSNCRFISSIYTNNDIDTFEANCINNCVGLNTLTIGCRLASFAKGFIGKNCTALTNVTLPYIGTSSNEPVKYSELNLSYAYTNKITLGNGARLTLVEGCFENCTKLQFIVAQSGFTTETHDILKGKNEIEKMIIDLYPGESLESLVGQGVTVKNVLFTNITAFSANYFANMPNTNVYLGAGTSLSEGTITESSNISSLFISSYTRVFNDSLRWIDVKEGCVRKVYTSIDYGYVPENYQIFTYDVDTAITSIFR